MMKKLFTLFLLALLPLIAYAQNQRTVNVETAGSLPNLISDEEKYTIEELTLTGELNGTDFRLLRDMAGNNYKGELTEGKLSILDLTGVSIMEGGEPYLDTTSIYFGSGMLYTYDGQYYTSNDELPSFVFAGCSLQSVKLPTSITSIGNSAFTFCKSLVSVAIPDKVVTIGSTAFGSCPQIASITIPHSVVSIEFNAFVSCTGLTSLVVENGNPIYDSRDNCNAVIETATNKLVVGCLTSTIPNTVTTIGVQAFNHCPIQNVTIPTSVKAIEMSAFMYSGITSLIIPSSVTSIENSIVRGCEELTSIVVEAGNPKYDSRDNCNAIIETASNTMIAACSSTVIPADVPYIGEWSFCQIDLESFTVPGTVRTISANAFYNCPLRTVVISEGVENVGIGAFRVCHGLNRIEIPSTLKTIDIYAFLECEKLDVVVSHITDPFPMDDNVFSQNSATLYVPVGSKAKYEAIPGWTKFAQIVEGDVKDIFVEGLKYMYFTGSKTATVISDDSYKELKTVEIPPSITVDGIEYDVTEIGREAFYSCRDLTTITIPASLISIKDNAFWNCDKLKDVYCLAVNPPSMASNAFIDFYLNQATLHVPASSVAAYSESEPWKYFKEIVAIEEIEQTYALTYKVDGEVYKTYNMKEGDIITLEEEPTKDGYEFSSWSAYPATMPAWDVTIYGNFDLIADYDEITLGSTGKGTFSSRYDLNFTDVEGLKAYTATGYESEENTVWLSRVLRVPAETGLMVKGEAGKTYKVPHTTSVSYYTNLFRANTGTQISIGETEDEWTNYYLSGGQFKKVNGSANIGHKKCYLQLPSRFFSKTRSIEIVYGDEEEGTTGIDSMDNAQRMMEKGSDAFYNLQGQRVENPTKGIYIHKGKKVVIR